MKFARTRIAPTPSGYLHLGNAYAFAMTAAIAQRVGAKLLLRIDDMDRDRVRPEFIADIFDSLAFLGIHIDEGPKGAAELEHLYSQRLRLPLYEAALAELAARGNVYACRCSRSEAVNGCARNCRHDSIALDEPGCSWRLNTANTLALNMKSLGQPDQAVFLPDDMRDFVVRRKDGYPAYQICSLIDDLHFGVDLVVRGNDLLASTAAQLYLAACLQRPAFSEITFFHHRLLLSPEGAKLSKSAGDTSLHFLRTQGKTPAEVYESIGRLAGITQTMRAFTDLSKSLEVS